MNEPPLNLDTSTAAGLLAVNVSFALEPPLIVTSVTAEPVATDSKIKHSASAPEPTEALIPSLANEAVGFVAIEAGVNAPSLNDAAVPAEKKPVSKLAAVNESAALEPPLNFEVSIRVGLLAVNVSESLDGNVPTELMNWTCLVPNSTVTVGAATVPLIWTPLTLSLTKFLNFMVIKVII